VCPIRIARTGRSRTTLMAAETELRWRGRTTSPRATSRRFCIAESTTARTSYSQTARITPPPRGKRDAAPSRVSARNGVSSKEQVIAAYVATILDSMVSLVVEGAQREFYASYAGSLGNGVID